jgi:hypothetical protein
MKGNIKTWLFMLILIPLISGVYGILHDQVTFSISSEYFTNFKFIQFRIADDLRDSTRLAVAIVGFLATWWVGIPLALILGIIGQRKLDSVQYQKLIFQSVKVVFVVAILFGVIGYFAGLIVVSNISDWPMNIGGFGGNPELMEAMSKIKDWDSFMVVGMIHNFSYLGAVAGLVVALLRQYRAFKRLLR